MCQFTFNPVQDNTIYGLYWDAIEPERVFVKKEDISAFNFQVNANPREVAPSLINGIKYSNQEEDKIIQLHNNSISVHFLNNYSEWNDFKGQILDALQKFRDVANKTSLNRIDLRAINVFEFESEGFSLSQYFNVNALYPKAIGEPRLNLTLEWPINDLGTFIVARFKTSNTSQNMTQVVLDLSYVNVSPSAELNDETELLKTLDDANSQLYELFSSILTEKSKTLIK